MTEKDALRQRVWDTMEAKDFAAFPRPVHRRIPNFKGADRAAQLLAEQEIWRRAKVIKSNPDAAQQPVRQRALEEGKTLYMAVPKLAGEEPFVRVRGKEVSKPRYASTIKGAMGYGRPVGPDEMEKVDLVVAGCVAVNRAGARLGKGGGFSDLEFALTRAYGVVSHLTPVVTTLHDSQVLREEIPMNPHDEPVDFVATPQGFFQTEGRFPKPRGIRWELLTEKQIASIPILQRLKEQRTDGRAPL